MYAFFTRGISWRHGPHHVAQKSIRMTLPFQSLVEKALPSTLGPAISTGLPTDSRILRSPLMRSPNCLAASPVRSAARMFSARSLTALDAGAILLIFIRVVARLSLFGLA